ncbi:MAG: sodium ion-translocating decarboxylase subunit beta, partial [Gammaproteobacteria bacterium]|nr:sodium ion-translocating decarboxylase subunit beta [Gammaproteobacteria bacterium]
MGFKIILFYPLFQKIDLIGCGFIYLAIAKEAEPVLLLPIGLGIILANIPLTGMTEEG